VKPLLAVFSRVQTFGFFYISRNMHEPFKTNFDALYVPLIFNMMPALVNLGAINAFKGTINVNFLGSESWLEIKSQRY
jgi:hypothetical protein